MLKTEERNPNSMNIDEMSAAEIANVMQLENYNAVKAIDSQLENIAMVIDEVSDRMKRGGRLFYVGCGTSGRLGVLDASECPPTFGVSRDVVIGIIAGGRDALTYAVEGFEDNFEAGFADLESYNVNELDSVIGISVAGGAEYVLGALKKAKECRALTVALTCNKDSRLDEEAAISIITDTGAEVITGSSRLKAGSAHKMVLNMISTGVMVKMGYVYENMMINLKPSNKKLKARMVRIVRDITGLCEEDSLKLLENNDFVIKKAVESYKKEDTK